MSSKKRIDTKYYRQKRWVIVGEPNGFVCETLVFVKVGNRRNRNKMRRIEKLGWFRVWQHWRNISAVDLRKTNNLFTERMNRMKYPWKTPHSSILEQMIDQWTLVAKILSAYSNRSYCMVAMAFDRSASFFFSFSLSLSHTSIHLTRLLRSRTRCVLLLTGTVLIEIRVHRKGSVSWLRTVRSRKMCYMVRLPRIRQEKITRIHHLRMYQQCMPSPKSTDIIRRDPPHR